MIINNATTNFQWIRPRLAFSLNNETAAHVIKNRREVVASQRGRRKAAPLVFGRDATAFRSFVNSVTGVSQIVLPAFWVVTGETSSDAEFVGYPFSGYTRSSTDI